MAVPELLDRVRAECEAQAEAEAAAAEAAAAAEPSPTESPTSADDALSPEGDGEEESGSGGEEEGDGEEDEKAKKRRRKAEMAPLLAAVRALADHRHGYMFRKPVKDSEAPGYSEKISHPMDLGTCSKNLEKGAISTSAELFRDLELMIQNAIVSLSTLSFAAFISTPYNRGRKLSAGNAGCAGLQRRR